MEEQILRLRSMGYTYTEIQKIVGCAKSTVSYYCGDSQKIKTRERNNKICRKSNNLNKYIDQCI